MENEEKSKTKLSSKDVSRRENKLTWERYEAALNGVFITNQTFNLLIQKGENHNQI